MCKAEAISWVPGRVSWLMRGCSYGRQTAAIRTEETEPLAFRRLHQPVVKNPRPAEGRCEPVSSASRRINPALKTQVRHLFPVEL